ncbi:hypothetical protein GCM10011390_41950 [Aureimonas endophytica]|uniref:Uncharacterized protein n=1 Tax=Aureimonas endophytica TaxID=2027858 RepID=A0A916ZXU9_9HYPH|nr:RusA family crossover junction endodeoxyribonuclease [Aureimonas endophytica]GGE18358.1 hypothetical protein GCM10011390_41950 [Aureimonas endophytica]
MNLARDIHRSAPVAGCCEQAGREGTSVAFLPVAFTVPMPPSVNHMFKNLPGRGRVKTDSYIDWQMSAKTAIRRQAVPSVSGRVMVNLGFELGVAGADIDNRIKALLDLLSVNADSKGNARGLGIIEDDSLVVSLTVCRLPPANGLAHVQIHPPRPTTAVFHPAFDGASGAWIFDAPIEEDMDDGDQLS